MELFKKIFYKNCKHKNYTQSFYKEDNYVYEIQTCNKCKKSRMIVKHKYISPSICEEWKWWEMIEVNYNEYKETIADNMKLIQENHKLKERIDKAREYITTIKDEDIQYTIGWVKQDILQILDKVEEK